MARFEPVAHRRELASQLGWFALWFGTTLIAAWLTPSPRGHATHTQLGLPPCPSTLFFDRPCPGCGLTTSFSAIVHLDPLSAFRAHPFGPLLYAAFTVTALLCLYGWFKRMRFNTATRAMDWALGTLVVVFFAFGVYRFFVTPNFNQVAVTQVRITR